MTAEQQEQLKRLQAAVKVIADHQAALQSALDADVLPMLTPDVRTYGVSLLLLRQSVIIYKPHSCSRACSNSAWLPS